MSFDHINFLESESPATLWLPNTTTLHPCGDSLLAICLAGRNEAIYRPPEHQWMRDSKCFRIYLIHSLMILVLHLH